MLRVSGVGEQLFAAVPLPLGAFTIEKALALSAATFAVSVVMLFVIAEVRGRGRPVFYEAAGNFGLGVLIGCTGIGIPIGLFLILRSFWIAACR